MKMMRIAHALWRDSGEIPISAEWHGFSGNRGIGQRSGAASGAGPPSARRAVLHLMKKREGALSRC
jgi:hypothetical protein